MKQNVDSSLVSLWEEAEATPWIGVAIALGTASAESRSFFLAVRKGMNAHYAASYYAIKR
jgi:hypothetical protein